MKVARLIVASLLLGFVTAPAARAWHGPGHMLVAGIAWEDLKKRNPAKAAKIQVLLEPMTSINVFPLPEQTAAEGDDEKALWLVCYAATWPDEVRQRPKDPALRKLPSEHRAMWHFYNDPIPVNFTLTDAVKRQLDVNLQMELPPNFQGNPDDVKDLNAVQAIAYQKRILANHNASAREKAVAVCWLLHIVGDLHQPLHTTTMVRRQPDGSFVTDRGGNLVWLSPGRRSENNLHSHWDGLFDEELQLQEDAGGHAGREIDFHALSHRIEAFLDDPDLLKDIERDVDLLDPGTWIVEGRNMTIKDVDTRQIQRRARNLANSVTITRPPPNKPETSFTSLNKPLSAEYDERALDDAEHRVLLAGLRLSRMLEAVP